MVNVSAVDNLGHVTACSFFVNVQNDDDNDNICHDFDNCPEHANADQADTDADGSGNACDNCPLQSNANQIDTDADGLWGIVFCFPLSFCFHSISLLEACSLPLRDMLT